jgi:hypothetical protein
MKEIPEALIEDISKKNKILIFIFQKKNQWPLFDNSHTKSLNIEFIWSILRSIPSSKVMASAVLLFFINSLFHLYYVLIVNE